MKAFRTLLMTLAAFAVPASPVFAATTRSDHRGFVVWMFLGFCGLIVVAQLLPAVLVLLGLVHGVTRQEQKASLETN